MTDGECFGEAALLFNCERNSTVKAMTKTQMFRLHRIEFKSSMEDII